MTDMGGVTILWPDPSASLRYAQDDKRGVSSAVAYGYGETRRRK